MSNRLTKIHRSSADHNKVDQEPGFGTGAFRIVIQEQ
jgi:hypothetical protein